MGSETGPMDLDRPPGRRRLSFDPTINAGHLLTFVGLLSALILGWNTLDGRVVRLEEAKLYQVKRDDAQDTAIGEKLIEIREAIKDVRHGVDELRRDGKTK